jgi:putative transposase
VKRKNQLLYSPRRRRRRPGPKGPSKQLISAVTEMKRRNPRFGCRKIAEPVERRFLSLRIDSAQKHWIMVVMDVFTRRIIGFGVAPADLEGPDICRMFNRAIAKQTPPKYLSSDNDRLFRFHRWLANLRILEIDEIKSIPCMPRSHAFVERLIGTVQREFLDRTLFWNQGDLERKLDNYRNYYNRHRCHTGLAGVTPADQSGVPPPPIAKLESYSWRQHCNALFQTPIAA